MKKSVIIIPARYESTRLRGKPLLEVKGKPIIQWVYERAMLSKRAHSVIVATDNVLIFDKCKSFGAKVEMTSKTHKSGSDRIAQVVQNNPDFEYIVNIQGDEPLIDIDSVDSMFDILYNDYSCDIATQVRAIEDSSEIDNPNIVKCVFDKENFALFFSRSKIPYERNKLDETKFFAHIGVYAYKRKSLLNMTLLPQCELEKVESLEQLRALFNGMKIKVNIVDKYSIGIDTIEDFEKFKSKFEH